LDKQLVWLTTPACRQAGPVINPCHTAVTPVNSANTLESLQIHPDGRDGMQTFGSWPDPNWAKKYPPLGGWSTIKLSGN
jgi:hypothetical protein